MTLLKRFWLPIVLVAIVILAIGITCSPSKTETSNLDKQANEQKKAPKNKESAVLYLGSLGEPAMGFDPILGWANVDGTSIFHSNLLKQDANMNIVPDLAESYSLSDDAKTYTFKIRQDAKFSNGKKVLSKDAAFTFIKAKASGYVGNLDKIEKIETPDDKTLAIHLSEPNSLFIYSIIRLGIVSEEDYDLKYGKNPIGTGPYKLVQWDQGQQLIVEANPYYFGKKPALKKLTFLFLGEEAAFEAAKKGILDLYYVPSAYVSADIKGMELISYKSADLINMGFSNPKKDAIKREDKLAVGHHITSDIAIRKAINIGINRQELIDGILGGYGKPAYDLVDPSMPWYNPEIVYKDNDIEAAKKILADAGWVDTDGDNILEKNGKKAKMRILAASDNKLFQAVAMATAEMLKRFGIYASVEAKSWEEIDTLIYTEPYVLMWGSKDPINIFFIYYSKNGGKGYYNSGYYKNAKVDEYIEKALKATNFDEANKFWKLAQWDGTTGFATKGDAPWLWLASQDHIYRIKPDLNLGQQGLQNPSMGWALLHNIVDWKWNEQ